MNETDHHFYELDFLRLLAVVGMVVFHLFFILDFRGILNLEMYQGGFLVLARFVQFTFLTLVGMCISISFQKWKSRNQLSQFHFRHLKRGVLIIFCGLLVSIGTVIIEPQYFVRFGVLHFIGTSIILFNVFAHRPYWSLIAAIVVYALSDFIHGLPLDSPILYPFGIGGWAIPTFDYFPIFPWASLILIGIFLGHILFPNEKRRFSLSASFSRLLVHLGISGKQSLIVYLIHVPIILGIIKLLML